MATSVPLGIVSLKAEGAYAADKLYKKGMWVTSSGSSYAYINSTPAAGVPVTNTSHWQQIAEKGNGIVSVNRTSGVGAPGSVDTYTITFDDDSTTTFPVYNGADNPNFTHIEEGLQYTSFAFYLHYATTQALIRDLDTRLAVAEAQLAIIP